MSIRESVLKVDTSLQKASTSPVASKLEGIQCLRLAAALLVVFTHSTFYAHDRLSGGFPIWNQGVVGVDIFFVISGLVMYISSARQRDDPNGWKIFAARRLVRIVPLYWAITTLNLIILLILPSLVKHSVLDWPYIAKSYLFIPAFSSDGRIEPLLGVGWTLIFEMFFYLVFVVSMILKSPVIATSAIVMSVCTVLSLYRLDSWPAFSLFFDPRALEFVAGLVIGRYLPYLRAPISVGLIGLLVGFLLLLMLPAATNVGFRIVTHVLPSALVVLSVVWLEPHFSGRWPKNIVFMGAASYSLYLIHPIVAPAVPAVLSYLSLKSAWISVLGSIMVSLISAVFVYLAFEKPVTRMLTKKMGVGRDIPHSRKISSFGAES